MRVLISLILVFGLATPSLQAQDRPSVPASVSLILTGGYWTSPQNDDGFYRVIIETGGFEHVVSDIWLEWLVRPTDGDFAPRIVATRHLEEISRASVYLEGPVFRLEGGSWILSVSAVQTHCDPPSVDRWNVKLGLPGEVAVISSETVTPGCNLPG